MAVERAERAVVRAWAPALAADTPDAWKAVYVDCRMAWAELIEGGKYAHEAARVFSEAASLAYTRAIRHMWAGDEKPE